MTGVPGLVWAGEMAHRVMERDIFSSLAIPALSPTSVACFPQVGEASAEICSPDDQPTRNAIEGIPTCVLSHIVGLCTDPVHIVRLRRVSTAFQAACVQALLSTAAGLGVQLEGACFRTWCSTIAQARVPTVHFMSVPLHADSIHGSWPRGMRDVLAAFADGRLSRPALAQALTVQAFGAVHPKSRGVIAWDRLEVTCKEMSPDCFHCEKIVEDLDWAHCDSIIVCQRFDLRTSVDFHASEITLTVLST